MKARESRLPREMAGKGAERQPTTSVPIREIPVGLEIFSTLWLGLMV